MKLLDRIKQFLFNKKNNIKLLTEAEEIINIEDKSKEWRESNRIPQEQLLPIEQVKTAKLTIEQSLMQYAEEYYKTWEKEKNKEVKSSSYSVLVGLNANIDDAGDNKQMQEKLLDFIYQNKDYSMQLQKSRNKSEEVAFFHFYQGNYEKDKDKMIKLYINTDRENVSELSLNIIQEMGENPFYFKMISDELMQKKGRTEKLVFYTNQEQLNSVISVLNKIKKEQPSLLKGSENLNPFIKRVQGFIGYAEEVKKNDEYINLYGQRIQVDKSYNSFLAEALEESMYEAMKDIVSKDEVLATKTDGEIGDMDFYMNVYPEIHQRLGNTLIQKMKENLQILVNNNNVLEIEGLGEENVR